MATALAKALTDVVERLDGGMCERSTLDGLRQLAERAEAELEAAAWAGSTTTARRDTVPPLGTIRILGTRMERSH